MEGNEWIGFVAAGGVPSVLLILGAITFGAKLGALGQQLKDVLADNVQLKEKSEALEKNMSKLDNLQLGQFGLKERLDKQNGILSTIQANCEARMTRMYNVLNNKETEHREACTHKHDIVDGRLGDLEKGKR